MFLFKAEDGDLIVRGIENQEDVIFTSDRHGAFNVSRAMLWAVEHGECINAEQDVVHTLQTMLRMDLDPELLIALNTLTDAELQRRTVLLYIDLGDGTHMLIDGNHRLAALAARAAKAGVPMISVPSFCISLADAQQFRVRYFTLIDGVETEIDSSVMLDSMQGIYSNPDGSFRDRRKPL